jgi:purine-binding chemotaxis protein CheW
VKDTYVRVRLGAETYALPVSRVEEVAQLGSLTPVPGTVASVLGVCNLRGAILAVYDFAEVLGIEAPGPRSRIVVAEAVGRRVGLAVDSVDDVAELDAPITEVVSGLLVGSSVVDDELVGFVDVSAVFEILGAEETA